LNRDLALGSSTGWVNPDRVTRIEPEREDASAGGLAGDWCIDDRFTGRERAEGV
jgi:hypothetical protein